MRRFFCGVVVGVMILSMGGCRSKDSDSADFAQENTADSSVQQSRTVNSFDENEESEEILPTGVTRKDKNTLTVTLKSVSVYDVYFPSEFFIQNEDLIPERGIYLQNDEGTATLLIELVDDNPLNNDDLEEYIRKKYPDAAVSSTEEDIICTYEKTDESDNDFHVFQITRMTDNGYITAVLCCDKNSVKNYESVFQKISIKEIAENE